MQPKPQQRPTATRMRFRCPNCTQIHDGLPAIAFRLPDAIHALPKSARATRALITSDLAILDDERFFIRGILRVPIRGHDEPLDYGPWIEVSANNFARYSTAFNGEADGERRVGRGHIANDYAVAETLSLGLACTFELAGDPNQRPMLRVSDPRHPLAAEQRSGIALDRAIEIASRMPGFMVLVS